jgi:hypothetical protein
MEPFGPLGSADEGHPELCRSTTADRDFSPSGKYEMDVESGNKPRLLDLVVPPPGF